MKMNLEIVNIGFNQCKHAWREIESDNKGFPTKYQCIYCDLLYVCRSRDKQMREYLDKKNSILTRIAENNQKIQLFELMENVRDRNIVISHLQNENLKLKTLMNVN